MKYQISALELHDYKMLHEVTIKPDADAVWIILGGDNANGKTGVLEAIEALIGGADHVIEDPVRHGAERAELRGKLQPDGDGPVLTIRRRIDPDGSTTLEVRDDIGKVRSPQALLDALVGKRFLDPISFLRLKAPEQRAKLLEIIDADGAIAEIDKKRQRLFDRRTEVGRDLKRATGAVESMPEVAAGEPIDVSALSAELQQIGDNLAEEQRILNRYADAQRELKSATDAVGLAELAMERAQKALDRARETLRVAADNNEVARERLPDLTAQANARQRRVDIQAEIKRAADHNNAVAARRAEHTRRAHLVAERDKHRYEHEELDRAIDEIDETKKARLLAAKLPIPGLAFTDTGITYNGAPFSSASGAQRMCVAIAMAAAAQPQLRDVCIRDAAILDDKTMAMVADFARANGIRPWLERVRTDDPGVIEIRDGRVAEPSQKELFK